MAGIMVTGGAGFLGLALVRALARRGDRVWALDTAVGPALAALAGEMPSVTPVVCDIGEWSGLMAALQAARPDAIVHAAAVVGVAASAHMPIQTMRVNVEGSLTLFEAMRLTGVRRMVHISTEETYGDFRHPVIDEDHPQNPVMAYGISKLTVEHLGRSYGAMYGLEVINLRTSWVYGPGLPRARVPKTLVEAAASGTPLHLPSGADWAVDHTHVDDFVAGTLLALDRADHPFDAYNLSSGQAASLREMVEILRDLVPGANLSVGEGPYAHVAGMTVPTVRKGALDIRRARDVLGYRPRYDIRSGLAAYLEAIHGGH